MYRYRIYIYIETFACFVRTAQETQVVSVSFFFLFFLNYNYVCLVCRVCVCSI